MLRSACNQVNEWLAQGLAPIRLAVNLSDRDLRQPDLVARVERLLAETKFPPSFLELELSENTIFRDLDTTEDTLAQLKKLGLRLAIDDFGTGYSTLSQLARFPFDTLKIDRRFAAQLNSSSAHAAIVSGIVTIAHKLGMEVVAEGVEDQKQLDFYTKAGCFNIQGWLFDEPALPEEILPRLRSANGVARPA
jgi:EAL domain-containing protein (putative c-di-GMP-specific phosphodiesterase class I)